MERRGLVLDANILVRAVFGTAFCKSSNAIKMKPASTHPTLASGTPKNTFP